MAVRLLTPGMVFLDNSGQPLDSGKIYTYETGTTTNKTTYTDADAGTPNANPVILDSNGRADIWLDTDLAYRIVVKTSADTTLDTVDGVIGPGQIDTVKFADNTGILDDSSNEHLIFQKTTTAVNYFEMTNAATGNNPKLSVAGSDANVGLDFQIKGSTGSHDFYDHNTNELFFIGPGVASAVNYATLVNSATGAGPLLSAAGSDSNIDFNFQIVGTGTYNFKATASNGSEIRIFEDTDNGTNYIGHKAADSLASSTTYTWPVDGSNGEVLITNGSGTLSWDSATTSVAASQADMETATATNVFTSPGRQQYHPSSAKAWVYFNGQGTVAISASFNVSSVTDLGTGSYQVNFTTAFSSTTYASMAIGETTIGTEQTTQIMMDNSSSGIATGSAKIYAIGDSTTTGGRDPDFVSYIAFGDQ